MRKSLFLFFAILIGCANFFYHKPAFLLDTSRVDWIAEDISMHYEATEYYRKDQWRFPIYVMKNYHPTRDVTLLETDSIPLFALFTKLIGGLENQRFQYFGYWFLLCFALQAMFGYLIARSLALSEPSSLLVAAIVSLIPAFIDRYGHPALCAHWTVLWAIWVYLKVAFKKDSHFSWNHFFQICLVNLVTLNIQPYLFVMTFVVSLPTFYLLLKNQKLLKIGSVITLFLTLTVLELYVMGFFHMDQARSDGFNSYSSDLMVFFIAMKSSFYRSLPYRVGQAEGFFYLGLSLLTVLILVLKQSRKKLISDLKDYRLFPLFIMVSALAVYSLSGWVRLIGFPVIPMHYLYRLVQPITEIFRTSGRFIWPFGYFVVIYILWFFIRNRTQKKQIQILSLILVAMIAEFGMWHFQLKQRYTEVAEKSRISDQRLSDLKVTHCQTIRELELIPTFIYSGCDIPFGFKGREWMGLSYLALQRGWTTESVASARTPVEALQKCNSQRSAVLTQYPVEEDKLYVLRETYWKNMNHQFYEDTICETLENFKFCLAKKTARECSFE